MRQVNLRLKPMFISKFAKMARRLIRRRFGIPPVRRISIPLQPNRFGGIDMLLLDTKILALLSALSLWELAFPWA